MPLFDHLVGARTRQNRSVSRLVFRKKRPAASTASMANVRASMADDELALVADSNSCCLIGLQRSLGQYAMPAVQSDAKKVTAHRFGNGAKETGSRFLHYSPRMNFSTFVPATVLGV
jgi:hypothetical protein